MSQQQGRRVLPHNLDAEASVLGGVLLRNEILTQLDTIEVEDFYSHHRPAHGLHPRGRHDRGHAPRRPDHHRGSSRHG
jgi:hypothetical protein